MKLDLLHKQDLKKNILIYALIGTIIYKFHFNVLIDTNSREFQYRILNR